MFTSFKTSPVKNHYQLRFVICKRWKFEPNDFWKKVIFSDETSFGLFVSDGKQWVCRPEGSRLKSDYMKTTVKCQGWKILYGCFLAIMG